MNRYETTNDPRIFNVRDTGPKATIFDRILLLRGFNL